MTPSDVLLTDPKAKGTTTCWWLKMGTEFASCAVMHGPVTANRSKRSVQRMRVIFGLRNFSLLQSFVLDFRVKKCFYLCEEM